MTEQEFRYKNFSLHNVYIMKLQTELATDCALYCLSHYCPYVKRFNYKHKESSL